MSGTTQIIYRQPYGLYLRQEALTQSWLVCQSELRDILLSHAYQSSSLLSETLPYLSSKLLSDVISNLPQKTGK